MKLVKCACGGSLGDTIIEKNRVKMKAQKCGKCGEVYIPGSEMLKYDMIKGKSSIVRKVRKSGDSMVVTVPKQIIEKFNVHDGDVIAFEPHGKEIKIKIVHTE
ncbi:MAG: hypothetical protein HYT73_04595 [Candidatus Aenigmarchaeota archaeon]|nr:hypothetical protein [Candidatus Aenigmarchaeota archaeon]